MSLNVEPPIPESTSAPLIAGVTPPVEEEPKTTVVRVPKNLRRLFWLAPFASATPAVIYAVTAYFVAFQVQMLDDSAKETNLALVNSISAVASMIAQPLIGVLSDRTRSRFGARNPWMLFGAIIGGVGLITAGLSTSLAILVIGVSIIQFGWNAFQGPFSAILPDRVPVGARGRYSTLVGLGSLGAAIAGPVLASGFAPNNIPTGYFTFAGVALIVVAAFLTFIREKDNRNEPREPFSASAFFKAFWVNPVRYPDFFWAFTGRFLILGAFAITNTYNVYIAQDYIGMSVEESAQLVPLVSFIALPAFFLSTALAGPISDRIGRRKPLVLIGGLILAVGGAVPLFMPTFLGMCIGALIGGLGVGAFVSVDQALVSQVLPNQSAFAKDLGVINIAATLPNIVAPIFAGVLLAMFLNNYAVLYIAAFVLAVVGALAVLPIKGAK